MPTITLRYLIQGLQGETPNTEDTPSVFHVEVNIKNKVGMLKESICKNNNLTCENEDLILWKLDIHESDERIKQLKTSTIEKVFDRKCEKLSDGDIIRDIFESCPEKNHIHIIYANVYTLSKSIFEKIIVPKNNDLVLWKVDIPENDEKIKNSSSVEKVSTSNHECEKLSDITKSISSSSVEKVSTSNHECEKLSDITRSISSSSVEKVSISNHKCEKLSDITKSISSIFEFPLKEENIHIIVSFEELMWMKINDVEVYTKTWKAKDEPKAYITFLHSYVDHVGFYNHIFSKFKDDNIEVNAFDQCGHGRTWKKNANPSVGKGWDDAIEDIKKFIEKQDREEVVRHFLMGHSVGGALALYATMYNKIEGLSGCIALSPLLKPFKQGIDLEIETKKLTSNRSFSQIYDDHTYINKYYTLTEVMDSLRYGNMLLKNKFSNESPSILIIYGTEDKISDINATKKFYNNLNGNSNADELRDECCSSPNQHSHCLHYDYDKNDVIDYCMQWILAGGRHSESSENGEPVD
ncbi:4571_t:CDS:2 [Gigaspora rosea]|nr:4571_t:CDS:2 [Gigaspora rosea]